MAFKLNLTGKVIAFVAIATMLTAGAIWWSSTRAMWQQIERMQAASADQYIRTLALVFSEKLPGAKVKVENGRAARIEAPSLADFSDFGVVDSSVSYVGGNATVFHYDASSDRFIRRVTTVKKENGERAVGTALAPESPAQAVVRRGETYTGPVTLFGRRFHTVYQPTFDTSGKVNGVLYAGIPVEEFLGVYDAAVANSAALALATALMVCALMGYFAARLFRPLRDLSTRMVGLAQGELDSPIQHVSRTDEIGAIARALEVFRDNSLSLQNAEQEKQRLAGQSDAERRANEEARAREAKQQAYVVESVATGLEKLSQGDLTYRLTEVFGGDYEKLRADFNAAMDQLQDTMRVVSGNASGIRTGASEISQAADDLSRRTEQQAASLEETAAALDEITATVRKTAEGATHARAVVSAAKSDAENSGKVVGSAVTAMSEIEKSAGEITQIIGVIDEIAFQTNLLALNAGVEAARAGEAGRGFAVVASEVRALAQRSAQAAKEIKALISTSSAQVETGVELVGETGKALDRIASQVAEINGIVSEIAASAAEQSTGLAEVNTAVNQMDQVTQQNAAMVEQSTAASHSLAQEAEALAKLIGRFRVGESRDAAAASARQSRAPAASTGKAAHTPRSSIIQAVTGRRGNLAVKQAQQPAQHGWEEF